MKIKYQKGFTLAEVMITLLIIAVLAMIMIPILKDLMPNKNNLMFRKAYFALSDAVNKLINDGEYYPSDLFGTDLATSALVARGFNYTPLTTPSGVNKFCYLLSQELNTNDVDCSDTNGGSFTTNDGAYWYMHSTFSPLSSNNVDDVIIIDVDGNNRGPNCTADTGGSSASWMSHAAYNVGCTKPDRFVVRIRYDGLTKVGCSTTPDCSVITDQKAINILTVPSNNK